jgi:hypothetical protein
MTPGLSGQAWLLGTVPDSATVVLVLALVVAVITFEVLRAFANRRLPGRKNIAKVSVVPSRPLSQRVLLFSPVLLLLINALDIKGYFLAGSGGIRYVILLPMIVALIVALGRFKWSTLSLVDRGFLIFVLMAAVGSVAGLLFVHPLSSALPLAIPSLLALSFLGISPVTEIECNRLVGWVEAACYVYVLVHLGASLGLIDSGINRSVGPPALFSNGAFTHEKVPILLVALHLALTRRSKIFFVGVAGAAALIYLEYPAGTYVAAAAAYLCLWVALRVRPSTIGPLFIGILVVALWFYIQITRPDTQLGHEYFSSVGKNDNVSTRSMLWIAATNLIKIHPAFGSWFAGQATVHVSAGNLAPNLPPHNDYLEVVILGGLFALGLFIAKLVAVGFDAGRSLSRTFEKHSSEKLLIEITTVALAGFMVDFIFNPTLLKLSLSALFFSLVGFAGVLRLGTSSVGANSLADAPAQRLTNA